MRSSRRAPAEVAPEDADDFDAAEAAAIRMIGGAGMSAAAVLTRLRQRGYTLSASRAAVTRCRLRGYINDDELARSVASRLQRTGHGRSRVAAELRARGVERETVESTLGALGADDDERALDVGRRLLDREMRRGRDDGVRRRIAGALQRRGFSTSVIAATLRRLSAE